MTTIAEQIALWADKLRDISAMGLRFSQNIHDRLSFQAVQDLAIEMLACAVGEPVADFEPLRTPIFSRPTPLAVGDAAIIDDAGRILLIQRADNRLWAMPGGSFDVGETPAQGAVREAWEETGVRCCAKSLVGVFDSRYCGTVSRHHLYQFVFLCEPLDDAPASEPTHAIEVLQTAWFAEPNLPRDIDPGHRMRIPAAFRAWHGEQRAFFDNVF